MRNYVPKSNFAISIIFKVSLSPQKNCAFILKFDLQQNLELNTVININLFFLCLIVSNQKSWPTLQQLLIQIIFHCVKRESLCLSSPFRSRKSTHFMMAGMWRASSSFCFLFSLSCPWQPWLCSMSCWTVGAAPKAKHTTSYKRKGQEAAASLWLACARSQNPTLRWYRGRMDKEQLQFE